MGRRSADRDGPSDARGADHESDLVDDRIGEDAPHVVFEQRVDDAVDRHDAAHPNERFPAFVAAEEGVDGGLRGISAEDEAAGDTGLGIGIGEPGGEGRGGRIDEEAEKNQPSAGVLFGSKIEAVEGDRPGLRDGDGKSGKEEKTAEEVDEDVAVGRTLGLLSTTRENDEGRGDGHYFPEHIERDKVAREDRAEGRPDVNKRGDVLAALFHVEGEDEGGDGVDREDVGEGFGKPVDAQEGERFVHPRQDAQGPASPLGAFARRRQGGDGGEGEHGQEDRPRAAPGATEERHEESPHEEDQGGVDFSEGIHRCLPAGWFPPSRRNNPRGASARLRALWPRGS